MKKTYHKPQIAMEAFRVVDYVTACNLHEISADPASCSQPDWIGKNPELNDFWSGPDGFFTELICKTDFREVYDGGFCYQISSGSNVIAGS